MDLVYSVRFIFCVLPVLMRLILDSTNINELKS